MNSGCSATRNITVADTMGSAYLQQSAISGHNAAENAAVRQSLLCRTHDFFSSGSGNSWFQECQYRAYSGVPDRNRKAFD